MHERFQVRFSALLVSFFIVLLLGGSQLAFAAQSDISSTDVDESGYILPSASLVGAAAVTTAPQPVTASQFVVAKTSPMTYTGKAIKPTPKITYNGTALKFGVDYSLSYSANKNVGKAKISIIGKGAYVGSKTVSFIIKRASLSKARVSKISSKTYTGKAIKPTPTVKLKGVKLKKGRDYKLSYSSNKEPGTAKVKITGIGNYAGSKTIHFKITKPEAENKPSTDGGTDYWTPSGSVYPENKPSTGGGTVYWTPSGSVYHYSRYCSTLSRSRTIYSGSISSSGKSRGCSVCG